MSDEWRGLSDDTRVVHVGQEPDPATGAVVPPLQLASTFAQDGVGRLRSQFEYARSANPTRNAFEQALAGLESPEAPAQAMAFGSGLAATDTLLRTVLRPGDHLVIGDDVYGGTYRLVTTVFDEWGVHADQVDGSDVGSVTTALRPGDTKLVWVETPSNPLLTVADISAIAEAAHAAGAIVAVDNTFATPVLQKPLLLGADVVVHSVTKYLGGHSDLVMGALVVPDGKLADAVRANQNAIGAVAGPFDCWLAMRGMRTLALRMERHCRNAQAVAEALSTRFDVAGVRYPGLPDDPGYPVASHQMTGFGGMVSFQAASGETAQRVAEETRIFTLAESLGGVESLIEVPAAMTHQSSAGSARPVSPDLVRLSVGVEHAEDLIADLFGALDRAALGADTSS